MASIWIDVHGSGIGKRSTPVLDPDYAMVGAMETLSRQGFKLVDWTRGHAVYRCQNHVTGACAQVNVQKRD